MKKLAIALSIVVIVESGCSGVRLVDRRQIDIPKTFFERTITYDVDAQAKRYMTNLEGLLGHIKQLQAPLPDDAVLPLYRDADIDRNRQITALEAEAFYNDCVLRYEDSLGPVQFQ
jgi:hypothetical protein